MKSKWTLKVKQHHIDNSVHDTSDKCAIALALKDEGIRDIHIDSCHISIDRKERGDPRFLGIRYTPSLNLLAWQSDIMNGVDCKPITLVFEDIYATVEILGEKMFHY